MSPRHGRNNMKSPYFERKPYGHDNPSAKGDKYEAAIEAFFSRLISKLKFWSK
jgi:hypothetical protein